VRHTDWRPLTRSSTQPRWPMMPIC
jgi:hypothetical protein